MGFSSNKIKDRATEICESDDYQEAKDYEFNQQFRDMFIEKGYLNSITEDDVQGFIDSFTFPEEDEWCMNMACGEADDYFDAKYEEEKDRRMGL